MQTLRNSLVLALLFLACVAGLQVSFLLAQAAGALNDLHQESARALANADRTLVIIRETAEQQRGSYEIIARSTARSLSGLAQLIEETNRHLETLAPAAEEALQQTGRAAASVGGQAERIGSQAELLLSASTGAVENLERLSGNRELEESATHLARSAENMERMTAASADAATAVRDMLSPRKKSFWRRLLELMIPRPTVRVGP